MKKIEFDHNLWNEIVSLKNKNDKAGKETTIGDLMSVFNLTKHEASLYLFSLDNFEKMVSEIRLRLKSKSLQEELKAKEATIKNLEDLLRLTEYQFKLLTELDEKKKFNKVNFIESKEEDECTAIALFSDVHYERAVSKEDVKGLNEYNPKIARERIERYFNRLLWVIKHQIKAGYNIKNLVLYILGDLINGYIHEEYKYSNTMTTVETIVELENILLGCIEELVDDLRYENNIRVNVVMIHGNHGRTTDKNFLTQSYKFSYEWLMYKSIERSLLDRFGDDIDIRVSESDFDFMEIYGLKIRASHGNHFNYRGGVGGLYVPLMLHLYKSKQQVPFDRAYIGHWHMETSLPEVGINGSVIGMDSYAFSKGFFPQPPMQLFEIISSAKKRVVVHIPILLEDFHK